MEQKQQCPEVCDFRQHDHIWQRVAPGLEPYPAARQGTSVMAEPVLPQEGSGTTRGSMMQIRQESLLPGADPNPCCMGTAAAESLNVLTGFLEEELRDIVVLRYYDGKPLTEIADLMGLSYGAVKIRHQKALNEIRHALNGDEAGPVRKGKIIPLR